VREIERMARALTLSNQERETVLWLVQHQADLDDPRRPTLAELKRLLAHSAWPELARLAAARHSALPNGPQSAAALAARVAEIPAYQIAPPPLVTGDDLLARGVPQGPVYRRVLDELYTRQLDGNLCAREDALAALDVLLRAVHHEGAKIRSDTKGRTQK
jgi:poly(A) polymerase